MSHLLKYLALKYLAQAGIALAIAVGATSAQAQLELKIMAPAAPGGGWDGAARSLQQVMTKTGVAKSVQVTNVPGAGGTVGLAQFVNSANGDGSQLMGGWDDYYLPGDAFAAFLKSEQARIGEVLKSIGLAKP